MRLIRLLARPMLAGVFILGGIDVLRAPEPRAQQAQPVVERIAQTAPGVAPADAVSAVRLNAVVHVTGGAMLALGLLPRLAALALAGSLVPTTLGGHRFWELDDPQRRSMQRTHFLKNLAIMGGLLVVALD